MAMARGGVGGDGKASFLPPPWGEPNPRTMNRTEAFSIPLSLSPLLCGSFTSGALAAAWGRGDLRPQPVAYCIIYLGEGKGFLPRREEMFLLFLLPVFATLWSSREARAIYYSGRVFSALFCTQTNRFFQKQKGKKAF